MKVLIYGAGSIGNHLAHGCRTKKWSVTMCDIDPSALERTKKDIFPVRYGAWDESIRLCRMDEVQNESFDLVIIGTPPDTHLTIARDVLLRPSPPRAMLIEKPVCGPDLKGVQEVLNLSEETGTFLSVGYNHVLTENTNKAKIILESGVIGEPLTIRAKFREHWGGIFGAHPWLSGPEDTYLGFYSRGGGASGEHSHAINIWQHFAHLCGKGRITEVSAMLDMVKTDSVHYDRICQLNVRTENGLIGTIAQDVITEPSQKKVRIQGNLGYIEWEAGRDSQHDALDVYTANGGLESTMIAKTRPQDFEGEIDHIEAILNGGNMINSPIALARGLDTMLVIAAAHASAASGKTARIDYDAGYVPQAIQV